MMRTSFLILFVFFSAAIANAQIGPHKVLQTQGGRNLNSFIVLKENPIIKKVVQKRKGIEVIEANNQSHFISWDDIEVLNFGQNEYHFDFKIDKMSVSLYYRPYPYKISDQRLHHGIIRMSISNEDSTERLPFYKVIFLEDAITKRD